MQIFTRTQKVSRSYLNIPPPPLQQRVDMTSSETTLPSISTFTFGNQKEKFWENRYQPAGEGVREDMDLSSYLDLELILADTASWACAPDRLPTGSPPEGEGGAHSSVQGTLVLGPAGSPGGRGFVEDGVKLESPGDCGYAAVSPHTPVSPQELYHARHSHSHSHSHSHNSSHSHNTQRYGGYQALLASPALSQRAVLTPPPRRSARWTPAEERPSPVETHGRTHLHLHRLHQNLHQELAPEGPPPNTHRREAILLQLGGVWLEVCPL
ncbi:hypothetical protein COCON_G00085870 [Conger conger]|uniref:Uncharacterized protein n=1 Tax=Conger conger TaxID=82655 RepID=A0A9Q1DK35_CONCO|nr:hypothetical protein COCON_G00085870 [Conger conger]